MGELPGRDSFVGTNEEIYGEKPMRAQALRSAMFEVQLVINTLNISSSSCECCSRRAYNNWPEYQMYKTLSGVMTKLRNAYLEPQIVSGEPHELETLLGSQ